MPEIPANHVGVLLDDLLRDGEIANENAKDIGAPYWRFDDFLPQKEGSSSCRGYECDIAGLCLEPTSAGEPAVLTTRGRPWAPALAEARDSPAIDAVV
jgi:hypothetical protein